MGSPEERMEEMADSALDRVREASIMWYLGEEAARTWTVAYPMPELAPVNSSLGECFLG